VGNDRVYCAEKGDGQSKSEIVNVCLWFLYIEPESSWVESITHDDERPNPNQGLKEDEEMKWDIKSFVLSEGHLGFGG